MNPKKYVEKRIRGWLPKEPNIPSTQMNVAKTININFRVRGIIALVTGFATFAFGVALYFSLNSEPTIISVVIGFSVPFFVIGGLLLRAHYRVKKGQSPIGDLF